MLKDFCIFILSHGRPDRIYTLSSLKSSNYTGDWFILIDNEDPTAEEYYERYGEKVEALEDSVVLAPESKHVAKLHRGQALQIHLQDTQVNLRIATHYRGQTFAPIVQRHHDGFSMLHNMMTGQEIAILRYDNPGTQG